MKKLVILRGLPASGKSTFAKLLVQAAGYKRVNKDDLRSMLDDGVWSDDSEPLINDAFYTLVTMLMEHGDSIVADNTHGSERHGPPPPAHGRGVWIRGRDHGVRHTDRSLSPP